MSGKLRVGIVGCGTIADIHAQAILALDNAELRSFFSRKADHVAVCEKKYAARGYTDWEAFLSDPDLDAVSVCTPSGTHLDYGTRAAEAGKHVIVEKPIEVTLERGQSLINVCRDHGVQLAVIFQNRFVPEIKALKEKLEAGVIGDLFWGEAMIKWYRDQQYYDHGGWRGTLRFDGGGALINQGIHTIDLLQWFMGEVETVFGQTSVFMHRKIEGEDTGVAVMRFRSGAVGIIGGATSIQPPQPRKIELHGTKGTVRITDNEVEIIPAAGKAAEKKRAQASTGAGSPLAGFSIEPHKKQFGAIADAILRGEQPPLSGEEAMRSLAVVLSVYQSAEAKTPVTPDSLLKNQP